jgi:YHS domain-containing protein
MAYDPICGRKVDPIRATPNAEYKKRTYYFCSPHCRAEFERAAERVRCHEAARAGALLTRGKVRWGLA